MGKRHGRSHGEHKSGDQSKRRNERRKKEKRRLKFIRRKNLDRKADVEERFGYHTYRQCTSKRWYASKIAADYAASCMNGIFGTEHMAYHCKLCGGWHLTTHYREANDTVRGA